MAQALIAYIPAIHKGYIDLLQKFNGDVYLLGEGLITKIPRLDRDIRALPSAQVQSMLSAVKSGNPIAVIESADDIRMLERYDSFVMPDEDVSHVFASQYLKDQSVTYLTTFLRWDRQITSSEMEVSPNRIITTAEFDNEIMDTALVEAQRSPDWWRQVGAVIIKDGTPILTGHNRPLVAADYTMNTFGDPRSNFDAGESIDLSKIIHAEAGLIAEAAKRGLVLEGASIYVTTFPCPVCAKSVAAAGITKVFYSHGYSLVDAEDILQAFRIELILVKR
jgi:dCMP deaminase